MSIKFKMGSAFILTHQKQAYKNILKNFTKRKNLSKEEINKKVAMS